MKPANDGVDSLRTLSDNIDKHLRSLEVLGQNINQNVFISVIKSKLPGSVTRHLEIQKGTQDKWTVPLLRRLLNEYVVASEKAEKTKPERTQVWRTQNNSNKQFENRTSERDLFRSRNRSSAEALSVNVKTSETNSPQCRYCSKRHWSDECPKYKTLDERRRCLKGSCYRCLKEGHMTRDCKSRRVCVYCNTPNVHHRSLCPNKFKKKIRTESVVVSEEQEEPIEEESSSQENVLLSSGEIVLMQTSNTKVLNPSKKQNKDVRILLDSGSQRTYITESLAESLELQKDREQQIRLVTFGSEKSKVIRTASTKIKLQLANGETMTITANIVPNITGNIERRPISLSQKEDFKTLIQNLSLADTLPTKKEIGTIELLIGNDYYLDIIGSHKIKVQQGLYLLTSKLGWILTGRTSESSKDQDDINMFIMSQGGSVSESAVITSVDNSVPNKPTLEDFWKIEAIGIMDNHKQRDDEKAMEKFRDTLLFKDNRYSVSWPWKDEIPELPANRQLAVGRLKSLTQKFRDKKDLMKQYDSVIQDQLRTGIVEKVDRNQCDGIKHYLPHHAVIKPDRATTKLRIVYDASAKTRKTNRSLNECLFRGPVLLHDLCGTLIRFRLHKIGIVADIEKAFLQMSLQTSQRDVTRFLWLKNLENPSVGNDNIQEYRFCRVPFGVISSPFLLGATVDYHLDSYNTDIARKLKGDIYMDNLITGANSVQQAAMLYKDAKDIFAEGSMNIREWLSNSKEVNSAIPNDDRADDKNIKVLEVRWNTKTDTIGLKPVSLQQDQIFHTKRSVLKEIATVYDPLGLFSPVILKGKILLQSLWIKQLSWDDNLDEEDTRNWQTIRDDIANISEPEIPRCVSISATTKDSTNHLMCFCDASKKAYDAVVYLVQRGDNDVKTELIFSKTRLVPVKELTIPRLELMATLIGARCMEYVKTQIGANVQKMCLFTDSECVLRWINSRKTLPVFINNRVKEINEHRDISIHYVNSKQNPADIASRGCSVETLCSKTLWWHGPNWISESEQNWPLASYQTDDTYGDESEKTTRKSALSKETNEKVCYPYSAPFEIDIERYSSATKVIRVTAMVMRFIKELKGEKSNSKYLTSEELEDAEKMWIKHVQKRNFKEMFSSIDDKKKNNLVNQLGVYINNYGILRCRGRLENSELSESARFPILLPRKDRFTKLLIERVHKQLLHSGTSHTLNQVRQKYWIPRGRATVRTVIKECKVCRRQEGGPYKMPRMPALPKKRVTESTPFNNTGLDYLGPINIRTTEGVKKIWVCLFTCLVARAIHLEIIQDMSATQFILCLRRFIAQRGTPKEIISDNAPQFKVTSVTLTILWKNIIRCNEVQSYVSQQGIKWSFIVELAPWMGGFYERLVGIVKRALRKAIGRKLLREIQFQTVLKEVEAVVKSRPLVYVGDDIESSIVLTPSCFLCLNPWTGIPATEEYDDTTYNPHESTAERLFRMWKKGQKLLDEFWKSWRNEYLLSLRERTQSFLKCGRIQSDISPSVGDVVLIKDNLPRGNWRLGRIEDLHKSTDGHVRSAKVKSSSGRIIGRPLNLLIPLEVSGQVEYDTTNKTEHQELVRSNRPKRVASENAKKLIKDMV